MPGTVCLPAVQVAMDLLRLYGHDNGGGPAASEQKGGMILKRLISRCQACTHKKSFFAKFLFSVSRFASSGE
jgi:hypothetical protein